MMLLQQNKQKARAKGQKSHARTMMRSEADKAVKMNAHHVPLRQIVGQRLLTATLFRVGHDLYLR
jgi:hypothetical protein